MAYAQTDDLETKFAAEVLRAWESMPVKPATVEVNLTVEGEIVTREYREVTNDD